MIKTYGVYVSDYYEVEAEDEFEAEQITLENIRNGVWDIDITVGDIIE